MNYQLLIECYSSGSEMTKDELHMLEIELDTQIESIKVSPTQGCLKLHRNIFVRMLLYARVVLGSLV